MSARQPTAEAQFAIGDRVEKFTGDYHAFGEIRAVFTIAIGALRYVVEHKAEGGGSFCHIYSASNLRATTAKAEREELRVAELDAYREAARYDAMMSGPRFAGWDRSQLDRARHLTEQARYLADQEMSDHATTGGQEE